MFSFKADLVNDVHELAPKWRQVSFYGPENIGAAAKTYGHAADSQPLRIYPLRESDEVQGERIATDDTQQQPCAAPRRADWTIPQDWHRYDEQDHAMRDQLFARPPPPLILSRRC